MIGKTRKQRKGPSVSATTFPEGTIEKGNNGYPWVVKTTANRVQRWVPYFHAELHGFAPLTVAYLAKHIGDKITIYEREYDSIWPKTTRGMQMSHFVPNGNAVKGKTVVEGWLRSQKPAIRDNTIFGIQGMSDIFGGGMELTWMQVDSKNKTLVSSNVMNTEAFVRV